MRYVQGNDIYLNIFRMLIGRSVPGAEVGVPEVLKIDGPFCRDTYRITLTSNAERGLNE